MKAWAICKREILSYFVSPVAYFVLTGFLLLGGYFFFNLLGYFNLVLERYRQMPFMAGGNMPNLNQWVVEGYYQTLLVILVFLIPLLTMRLIAEDKKRGTFELLVTSPLSVFDIALGKFLGVAFIVAVMVSITGAFPLLLVWYGNPEIFPILSGFLGVLLCAIAFASIGMAASAISENQIVAGVSGMVVLLLLYVIHSPAESIGGVVGEFLRNMSPVVQVQDLIRGVVSLKSLAYFVSLILIGLFFSQRALDAHRWR